MRASRKLTWVLALSVGMALWQADAGFAQVNPAEITHPRLKAAEQTYFRQLEAMNRAIVEMRFPLPFIVSRYAGLDTKELPGADRRALEFVLFHDRLVLKVSGNYNAAFNAQLLTQNQRANRVFDEIIVPILQLIPRYFSPQVEFDGFGFEVSYHVRTDTRRYVYEGQEILTLVLDKADAFNYLSAQRQSQRQEVIDSSEFYVNGKEFGMALGERDPFRVEDLDKPRSTRSVGAEKKESAPAAVREHDPLSFDSALRPPGLDKDALQDPPEARAGQAPGTAAQREARAMLTATTATQADVDALQTKYQSQLGALAKEGMERYHFVGVAPVSFVIFKNQIYLQITLRNPAAFDRNATSIYNRAARSFDLFLAPVLKPVLDKVPRNEEFAGLDITVLNQFISSSAPSSEAVEFICPSRLLREFVDTAITNQDLINQSIVLVNGVRIALNLQRVE